MKIIINPKKYFEENICILIISLGFFDLISEEIHEVIKYPMILFGILLFIWCCLHYEIGLKTHMFVLITILITVIEILFSEGILFTQYLWDLGICMPVALALCYCKNFNFKKWLILYVMVTIFLLYRLFTSPDYYSILYSHSRNYISVFEIFLVFLVGIVAYKKNTVLPSWIYYCTAIVCVISVGRGGILAGFILLCFHIVQNIISTNKYNNKVSKIIILVVALNLGLIIMLFFNDVIIQKIFPRFSGIGTSGDSSTIAVNKRLWMWGSYIEACMSSIKDFILGSNPYPIVLKIHYRNDFNLHNSFFMMHVFYGVFGLVFVIIKSLEFIKYLAKEKSELVFIFVTFLFRAVTDYCFPGKLSAIIIWFAIFYTMANVKKKR